MFVPAIKIYLENNLLIKCLLLMDSIPAHPPGLEDDLNITCVFKIKFLPIDNFTTAANGLAK